VSIVDHYAAVAAPPFVFDWPSLIIIRSDGYVSWVSWQSAAELVFELDEPIERTPLETQLRHEYRKGHAAWIPGAGYRERDNEPLSWS
jgi:hypothetical protein